jgi:DNA mismatch repair protein MutS
MMIKKITPQDLYYLYTNMNLIAQIHDTVSNDSVFTKYFTQRSESFPNIKEFCQEITAFLQKHFLLDLCADIDTRGNFETNVICRGIDANLDENTRVEMESKDKLYACQKYLNGVVESVTNSKKTKLNLVVAPSDVMEYVKLNETEKSNFSLYATSKRCKDMKRVLPVDPKSAIELHYVSSFDGTKRSFPFNNSQTVIHIEKYTGANDYIESTQLSEICRKATEIKHKMKEMVNEVFQKIMDEFLSFLPLLEEIVSFIISVDLVFAKTHIARKYHYCRPTIDESATKSYINATDLRHCLIEQLNQEEIYVANDVDLGRSIDGVLLYGTNAVGKTSFIRAIGVAIIMAQAGLFVPATSFVFFPYKYLFTRIIGNDNIFKGLSTFAVEMTELRTILRLTNENSLILGDELCSGTESTSAISIFVAGIQQLSEKRSSFIFATHLHEIVNYEEITSLKTVTQKHLTVVYDKERDALIYDRKLKEGPGQNMYGLEVCKSLGLPEDFLRAAYDIRIKYNPACENTLSSNVSKYNAKKIKSALCEHCGKEAGEEVHHLQHQQNATENGVIQQGGATFHKNHVANLITLCEKCHTTFHKSKAQHKRVKTTKGIIVTQVSNL